MIDLAEMKDGMWALTVDDMVVYVDREDLSKLLYLTAKAYNQVHDKLPHHNKNCRIEHFSLEGRKEKL